MSRGKFATVTASLLARKGEARPWTPMDADGRSHDWASEIPDLRSEPNADWQPSPAHTHNGAHHHNGSHGHDGDKRYAIRMTAKEYERLGIIAVKRSVTRQHLMREMVEQFLQSAASQYCADCTCLDGETCGR